MKRMSVVKQLLVLAVMTTLCACKPKEEDPMIGPRSESAWKKWEEDQKALVETWGDTEVYAYINTIREDIGNLKARVIYADDFSLETESEELDALKKLYEDMGYSKEMTLEEFYNKLKDSEIRWVSGGKPDLNKIKDLGNEMYEVELLYYASADALMGVILTVRKDADGVFHTDFE
ncbi:MAG: hypothetical protein IKG15_07735 [Solobacterium sp.]|nr:hypothetical protein [Solobacterium sp.]